MIESAKELNRRFHNTKLALSYVLPLPSSLFCFCFAISSRVLHISKAPFKTLYLYVCFLFFWSLYLLFYTSCKMLNKQKKAYSWSPTVLFLYYTIASKQNPSFAKRLFSDRAQTLNSEVGPYLAHVQ